MSSKPLLFYGSVITPVSLNETAFLPRTLLAVSGTGIIFFIASLIKHDSNMAEIKHVVDERCKELELNFTFDTFSFYILKEGEWLMPGFVDTHTHAPQFPNIGIGGQYQLLDWLNNVTFPTEKLFKDPNIAESVYNLVVRRVLDSGTTTCCYYGTLHLEATKILALIVQSRGQRAFVGKCNMDRDPGAKPGSDAYIEKSAEQSIADTKELITYIRSLCPTPEQTLVHPILTPRFAISCTPKLLSSLGKLASDDPSLAIQTHMSENTGEITGTRSLFPDSTSYAGVYNKFGLLNKRTILAHAVHPEDEDLKLIQATAAGISHCPTSNFYLSSGVARIGELLDKGIKVGLGTDCSGGFSPSILTAIRNAGIASKLVALGNPTFTNRNLPLSALLYLSTLGGARVCNLESKIGSLEKGKEFDALLVSVRPEAGNPGLFANLDKGAGIPVDSLEVLLEKFFFCGDDRNVRKVWVRGRLVGGVDKPPVVAVTGEQSS